MYLYLSDLFLINQYQNHLWCRYEKTKCCILLSFLVNTHRVKRAIAAFSKMSAILDKVKENYRPTLNGEKLITDKELADFLKINKRSLVEYRKNGILPYYHIGGRILYKESDVERIMQENFYDVFGKE